MVIYFTDKFLEADVLNDANQVLMTDAVLLVHREMREIAPLRRYRDAKFAPLIFGGSSTSLKQLCTRTVFTHFIRKRILKCKLDTACTNAR